MVASAKSFGLSASYRHSSLMDYEQPFTSTVCYFDPMASYNSQEYLETFSQSPSPTADLSVPNPLLHYDPEPSSQLTLKRKRGFSFEELQSGSYILQLDPLDLEFVRQFGQPVLIPLDGYDATGASLQNNWTSYDQDLCAPMNELDSCYVNLGLASPSDIQSYTTNKSYTLLHCLDDSSMSISAPDQHRRCAYENEDRRSCCTDDSWDVSTFAETSQRYEHPAQLRGGDDCASLGDHSSSSHATLTLPVSVQPVYTAAPVPVHAIKMEVPPHMIVPSQRRLFKRESSVCDEEPLDEPVSSLIATSRQHAASHVQSSYHSVHAQPNDLTSHSFDDEIPSVLRAGRESWAELAATRPQLSVSMQSCAPSDHSSHTIAPSASSSVDNCIGLAQEEKFYRSHDRPHVHTHRRGRSPRHRSPSPRLTSSAMRLSPLPSNKRLMEKKPALACLFCRGRKIACGPPLPGSKDRTCNQCARRHLKCEYPSESRRGMRKRKTTPGLNATVTSTKLPIKFNRKR